MICNCKMDDLYCAHISVNNENICLDCGLVLSLFELPPKNVTKEKGNKKDLFKDFRVPENIKIEASKIFTEICFNEQKGHKGSVRIQQIFFCIFFALYKNKIYRDPCILSEELGLKCDALDAIKTFSWYVEDAQIIRIENYDIIEDFIDVLCKYCEDLRELKYIIRDEAKKLTYYDNDNERLLYKFEPRIIAISFIYYIGNKKDLNISPILIREKFGINIANLKKIQNIISDLEKDYYY